MDQKVMSKSVEEVAYNTAIKLLDYNKILSSSKEDKNYMEIEGKKINRFNELYLSEGIPSLCILYAELNEQYPGEEWDIKGHEYIQKIGRLLEEEPCSTLSMFSGISGIGLATVCLSKNGTRYKQLTNTINQLIKKDLEELLNYLKSKLSIDIYDYDAISGISGILNYCMLFKDEMKKEINLMLEYIVDLCKDRNIMGTKLPGWYIKSENQFSEKERQVWKDGCFNLGLSHGIPSLLVNLCNAEKLNIKVSGQQEMIEKVSKFLFDYRIDEKGDYGWNYTVSLDEYKNKIRNSECCRDAWCYGTPGVAYSLFLAGETLNNKEYMNYAIEAIKIAGKRLKGAYSPTFCHGYSGIAYISNKFYELTNINEFKVTALELSNKILSLYDEKNIFNFVDIEKTQGKIKYRDSIGILEGVTGIILTLLAIEKGGKTPWDVAFSLGDYKQRI